MYNYKVGDRFRWKKEACFEEEYFFNDIYELAKRGIMAIMLKLSIHGVMIMMTGTIIDMAIVMKRYVKE